MANNSLSPDAWLSPAELAKRWEVTTHTLAQWRWAGTGPQYQKIGRKIFYLPTEIKAFEGQKLRRHTAEK